ncbi:hypothetical protein NA57DRAFT_51845 [Rhizodiscina lignyota]|uniref:Uncharacterized protein n=1 Tax=Rhizodiscina lignyota TaxID=1504668 RepID=A0A9P4IP46_9PEZI|nr:hypothetical protein NA57DRAFT_51845 [Rhizodiscina lignyota]
MISYKARDVNGILNSLSVCLFGAFACAFGASAPVHSVPLYLLIRCLLASLSAYYFGAYGLAGWLRCSLAGLSACGSLGRTLAGLGVCCFGACGSLGRSLAGLSACYFGARWLAWVPVARSGACWLACFGAYLARALAGWLECLLFRCSLARYSVLATYYVKIEASELL